MVCAATASPYFQFQRHGFPSVFSNAGQDHLSMDDILESLALAAYREEAKRRQEIAAEIRRKKLQEQRRKITHVRVSQNDDMYQIQLFKQTRNRSHFKSYQIQYFKRFNEVLLKIESLPDEFSKVYKFDASDIDVLNIDYKILDNQAMVINIPKKRVQTFNSLFDLIEKTQEAEFNKRREAEVEAQQLYQRERELTRQRLQQQLALERLQQQKLQEKLRIERELLQRKIQRAQEEQQKKQQENLQKYLNLFLQDLRVLRTPDDESLQFLKNTESQKDEIPEHYVSEPEESHTESDSESEEELSDSEEDALDPEVSDISDLLNDNNFHESNTIKPVFASDVENDSESVSDSGLDSDSESVTKRRKVRSPSLEEVVDEEFLRWK